MYEHRNYVAYRGVVYAPDGELYRKLECYLPGDVGTLGEPIETTFIRWAEAIIDGKKTPSFADGLRYRRDGNKLVAMKKEKV